MSSARHVAFLKGINVGGHRVTMDDLRAALAPLGLEDVQTFIASGNVIFTLDDRPDEEQATAAVERRIEGRLAEALGYVVDTFLRPIPELRSVAEFTEGEIVGEGWKPHVMFGRAKAAPGVRAALRELETPDDEFRFHEREVVWMRRGGMTDSAIKSHHLNRALNKQPVTARTLKTVQRLVAKFGT